MYVCNIDGCGYKTAINGHFHRHQRTVHSKEKPIHCTYNGCTSTFALKYNLTRHCRNFHSKDKGFTPNYKHVKIQQPEIKFSIRKHNRRGTVYKNPYSIFIKRIEYVQLET